TISVMPAIRRAWPAISGACRFAALRFGPSALRRVKVDEISVGIPEERRAIAPRLVGGLQSELADEFGDAGALAVDVLDLELHDRRAIGSRYCGSSAIEFHGTLAADGQRAGSGSDFPVVVVAGRSDAGDVLVELR